MAGLSHIFPGVPFPGKALRDRWEREVQDPFIKAFVSVDDDGAITGFAATRGNELLHFGTALVKWGTGLAQELHDWALSKARPSADISYMRLTVFEENARARRFYEKLGWYSTGITTKAEFPPYPDLLEYRWNL